MEKALYGLNSKIDREPVPTYEDVVRELVVRNIQRTFRARQYVPFPRFQDIAEEIPKTGSNGHTVILQPVVPDYRPIMHTQDSDPAMDALRELGWE